MIKKLDLALLVIEKKASLYHPAFLKEDKEQDVFEQYRNLCEYNGHEPASSELGDFDKK